MSIVEALAHAGAACDARVSLRFVAAEALERRPPQELLAGVDGVLVPGGFGRRGLVGKMAAIRYAREGGVPFFGICLGMQLLFDRSSEFGAHEGLGLIAGTVEPLRGDVPEACKVPAIGWNALHLLRPEDPLLAGCREGECVYFVHSYYAKHCEASLVATAEYGGVAVPALVRSGSVAGAQFHPEKSGAAGLAMLRAFAASCGALDGEV